MKNKVLLVLCLLAGLVFINAGLDKFLHYMPVPKNLPEKMLKAGQAYQAIGWLIPLVGATEVLGGLLLMLPGTRPLGAIVLVPVLTGILLTNITVSPAGLPFVLALIGIIFWVIVDNRERFLSLVNH
jgi:uncharacterized membrane protein YphA (DoxX/SURF4 family)